MGPLPAFALLAAAASGAPATPAFTPTGAVAPARASVRILSGAKVRLSAERAGAGQTLGKATITVEDGSRRPAQLVEFQ